MIGNWKFKLLFAIPGKNIKSSCHLNIIKARKRKFSAAGDYIIPRTSALRLTCLLGGSIRDSYVRVTLIGSQRGTGPYGSQGRR